MSVIQNHSKYKQKFAWSFNVEAYEHQFDASLASQRERCCNLPDAFPMCFMSLNPIVTAMQRIISIQLISGM